MEDAATAEISRSQLWQWIRHGSITDAGKKVTKEWVDQLLDEEISKIRQKMGDEKFKQTKFELAKVRFGQTLKQDRWEDFLTLVCYDDITSIEKDQLRATL